MHMRQKLPHHIGKPGIDVLRQRIDDERVRQRGQKRPVKLAFAGQFINVGMAVLGFQCNCQGAI